MREKMVDINVYKRLESLGFANQESFIIEQDDSKNIIIHELLSDASKTGKGNRGYPDFIIQSKKDKKTIIIIENKASIKKHNTTLKTKNIQESATDGVLHYAEKLKQSFDVIAIAYSQSDDEIMTDTYFWTKGSNIYMDLQIKNLASFEYIMRKKQNIFKQLDTSEEKEAHLKKVTTQLNNKMRDLLELEEEKRAILAASILLSLDNSIFKVSYIEASGTKELSNQIYSAVKNLIVSNDKIQKNEADAVLNHISFIKNINDNDKGKLDYAGNSLKHLVDVFRDEIFAYFRNSKYDVIGYFFMSFLKYATKGGGDLGVVLTPNHVAELFVGLTKVNKHSKVFDPTMGTGSFLIKSWEKIHAEDEQTLKESGINIETKGFINAIAGIELKPSMYTLSFLNMLLNKAADQNQFKLGSALNKMDLDFFKEKYNVGLINPPYSHGTAPELKFVEQLLDVLLPKSLCAAIIPVNAVSKQSKKHGDLSSIKKRILSKHNLIASIQMPAQLFYPKGTETVILLFETATEHSGDTWFTKWDDEFKVVKQRGRIQVGDTEKSIKDLLLNFNSKKVTDTSFNKEVTHKNQWVYSVLDERAIKFDEKTFMKTVKEFEVFKYLNNIEGKNE